MDHLAEKKILRLFCAVELPLEVRARATAHAAHLRESIDALLKVSWEREAKMHVTLKFFGDVEPLRVTLIESALSRCAARAKPFALRFGGCGVFASTNRPNVLWLGIMDESGGLTALQRDLEDECARAGFPRDARRFHPHLTIARIRVVTGEARRLARLHIETKFAPATFNVGEIVLLRSEPGAGGSTYAALSRHVLKVGGVS